MKLTIDDLKRIKEEYREKARLKTKIIVHLGTCGIAAGGEDIMSAIMTEIRERNISDIIVTTSGCPGMCSKEPMITIEAISKPPVKYGLLDRNKIKRIFSEGAIYGNILADLALGIGCERIY